MRALHRDLCKGTGRLGRRPRRRVSSRLGPRACVAAGAPQPNRPIRCAALHASAKGRRRTQTAPCTPPRGPLVEASRARLPSPRGTAAAPNQVPPRPSSHSRPSVSLTSPRLTHVPSSHSRPLVRSSSPRTPTRTSPLSCAPSFRPSSRPSCAPGPAKSFADSDSRLRWPTRIADSDGQLA